MSILLPDGRSGFAKKDNMQLINKKVQKAIKPDSILHQAYKMMGIPYLWGGNSTKGNDCSGFTQTIFKANGIQLPRDARQQALEGIAITPNGDWSNILEGDLLFFPSLLPHRVSIHTNTEPRVTISGNFYKKA